MKPFIKEFFLFQIFILVSSLVYSQNLSFDKTFAVSFDNGTQNHAVYLVLPEISFAGEIDVTITSTYSHQLSGGNITKGFAIIRNPGQDAYCYQDNILKQSYGEIVNQWYIGNYDQANHRIPIYHMSANPIFIKVKGLLHDESAVYRFKTETSITAPQPATIETINRKRYIITDRYGINTSNPAYELDVNGTIHAREIKVDVNSWADHVFEDSYQLITLDSLERYIQLKGHLPDLPSKEDVMKNGINITDNQKLLLQKIEELTLYMIKQHKINNEQALQLEKYKKEIELLKKRNK